MDTTRRCISAAVTMVSAWLIVACGGGGGGGAVSPPAPPPAQLHTVGGAVSALATNGYLTLQNLGGNYDSISANGPFAFTTLLPQGSPYAVALATQKPGVSCSVANGSGFVDTTDVTTVSVDCSGSTFNVIVNAIGVNIGGYLALQNNGEDALDVVFNGVTDFNTPLASGQPYAVSVQAQPKAENCILGNVSGTIAGANVVVQATCPHYLYYSTGGALTSVAAYSIDPSSGALAPSGAAQATGPSPVTMAVEPLGRFAYVGVASNQNDAVNADAIWGYAIDATSGALTPTSGSPYADPANSSFNDVSMAFAFDPAGKFLYELYPGACGLDGSSGISAYAIDQSSGALATIAGAGQVVSVCGTSLTMHPSGKFLIATFQGDASLGYPSGIWVYAIDPVTGNLRPLQGNPYAAGAQPLGLALTPSGEFAYFVDMNGAISAYRIDPSTGVPSAVPGSPFPGSATWNSTVAIDPSGQFAFALDTSALTIYPYTIDASTGALTPVPTGPVGTGGSAASMVIHPSGQYLYVNSASGIWGYSITKPNVASQGFPAGMLSPFPGQVTTAGNSGFSIDPSGTFAVINAGDALTAYTIDGGGNFTPAAGNPVATGGAGILAIK